MPMHSYQEIVINVFGNPFCASPNIFSAQGNANVDGRKGRVIFGGEEQVASAVLGPGGTDMPGPTLVEPFVSENPAEHAHFLAKLRGHSTLA